MQEAVLHALSKSNSRRAGSCLAQAEVCRALGGTLKLCNDSKGQQPLWKACYPTWWRWRRHFCPAGVEP